MLDLQYHQSRHQHQEDFSGSCQQFVSPVAGTAVFGGRELSEGRQRTVEFGGGRGGRNDTWVILVNHTFLEDLQL